MLGIELSPTGLYRTISKGRNSLSKKHALVFSGNRELWDATFFEIVRLYYLWYALMPAGIFSGGGGRIELHRRRASNGVAVWRQRQRSFQKIVKKAMKMLQF